MSVDHLQLMRDRLIDQFKGLPNLDAFIRALGDQLNDVEEFYGQLLASMDLQTVTGAQLDDIGVKLLGQSRNSMNDDQYRAVLQSKIIQYQSQGTIEDLIQIGLTLGGASRVSVVETGPATIQVALFDRNSPVTDNDLITAMRESKIAGVEMGLILEGAGAFAMDPEGEGFGDDTNTATGGQFVDIITP